MNCKKIQELIITDYHDNETSGLLQRQVDEHVATCADCRAFEQAVRRNSDMLFKDLGQVQPPEAVWHKIRDSINEEQYQKAPAYVGPSLFERMLDFLRESFIVKRPAYALATVLSVILITVVFWRSPLRQQMLVKDYLSQKSAFMVAMNSAPNGEIDKVAEFNTAIEQYLF
jgi:predicted anti-sigma-YlaC factor YlaD